MTSLREIYEAYFAAFTTFDTFEYVAALYCSDNADDIDALSDFSQYFENAFCAMQRDGVDTTLCSLVSAQS